MTVTALAAARIRVGIIGTGVMGAEHARILDTAVTAATVAAVLADADLDRASALCRGLSAARVVDDPAGLVGGDDVDAVVVASSDPTHEAFVLACLAAGKPVLCEKPLAPTEPAAGRILQAEQRLGRRLVSVGFMRRFDPGYLELKATLGAGVVGAPLVVHCVHRNASSPGAPGPADVVTSSVVHEIDLSRWLLGDEIVAVRAVAPRHRDRSGPDVGPVLVTLESAAGTVVDVEAFVQARYGYDVRCEIVGETGSLTLDAPAVTAARIGGEQRSPLPVDWRPRFAEAYRRELQEWVSALRRGCVPPTADVWDGYVAAVVAAAAQASLAGGGRVEVHLGPRPTLYGGS